jgi:polar amino acid transport system substrate-binding protein
VKHIFYSLLFLLLPLQSYAFSHGELRIATYIEEPFSYIKNNELVGEHIEIAKLLAKSVHLEPLFIHCPFARCLAMVKHGQADMIFGLRKLPEREIYLTFLTPPYMIQHYPIRFFTLKSAKHTITKFNDLKNLTVGVLRGATYFDQFDKSMEIKKVALTTREQLIKMLFRGRIDTFLEREETIKPLVSTKGYKEKLALADYMYDRASATYIAISKHSKITSYAKQLTNNLTKFVNNGIIQKLMKQRIESTKASKPETFK